MTRLISNWVRPMLPATKQVRAPTIVTTISAVPIATPSAAGPLVQDAESCKIPLVSMTIDRGTADIGSTIRIRSGSYVSPYFTVTEGMQRVAVPYPAPYGSGVGTIIVEGNAHGAILGLTPTRVMIDLPPLRASPSYGVP